MIIYFRYTEYHSVLKLYTDRKQGYIFDFGMKALINDEFVHIESGQLFCSENIKSQIALVNNATMLLKNFMDENYYGKSTILNYNKDEEKYVADRSINKGFQHEIGNWK